MKLRFDSAARQESDFEQAVLNWDKALALDPNQYIFRRRIQQYGPRQTKPYPFYDWIPRATEEITKRGDEPLKLTVALSGAETARPLRRLW